MDTCRICLRRSTSLKPLFTKKNSLANRINDLFNFDFEITQSESHPQKICYDCTTDLHHAMKFYENARSAEHQLLMQQEVLQLDEDKDDDKSQNNDEQSDIYELQSLEPTEAEVLNDEQNVTDSDNDKQELLEIIPIMANVEDDQIQTEIIDEMNENFIIEEVQHDDSSGGRHETIEEFIVKSDNILKTRSFTCEYCSKTYGIKASLLYHIQSKHNHGENRKFECSYCNKRFVLKNDLVRHQRIHTNEKRFECRECGKKFTDRSTHIKHEKIHNGIKPHTCDICLKSFTHKYVLDNHILIHSGEKKFVCPKCCKRFIRKAKMKEHFARVHKQQFTKADEQRSFELSQTVETENVVVADDLELEGSVVILESIIDQ